MISPAEELLIKEIYKTAQLEKYIVELKKYITLIDPKYKEQDDIQTPFKSQEDKLWN
jgi:hypothetical protein